MLNESDAGLSKVVTSLKVAALVVVLGSVVLAAEQHRSADTAPGMAVPAAATPGSQSTPNGVAQAADAYYFPAQYAPPSGPVAEQPPTF